MAEPPIPDALAAAPPGDFGFGRVVTEESRLRLLNPDGSFNVERTGLGFWHSLSLYHALLRLTWPQFLLMLAGVYLGQNALFALGFLALGPEALDSLSGDHVGTGFARAFFFSVQTFAGIGYGRTGPVGPAANTLVVFEALVGLVSVALATGIVFARFSRPTAMVRFSRHALVAPHAGGRALMLRMANTRRSELIELRASVVLSIREGAADGPRRFYPLMLERPGVTFFPLTWTLVHSITPQSPLHGLDARDLDVRDAEVLVMLTALDEVSSSAVHARTSYLAEEIVWHARFGDVFVRRGDRLAVDVGRLDAFEPVAPPAPAPTLGP